MVGSWLDRDKHSSLFSPLVNYVHKKFYNIGLERNIRAQGVFGSQGEIVYRENALQNRTVMSDV